MFPARYTPRYTIALPVMYFQCVIAPSVLFHVVESTCIPLTVTVEVAADLQGVRWLTTVASSPCPRTTGCLNEPRIKPCRHWLSDSLVRRVLAHRCASQRIWFTRFKQGRKPIDLCGSFGGITSTLGLLRIFGRIHDRPIPSSRWRIPGGSQFSERGGFSRM
jgi:hypothetical protein